MLLFFKYISYKKIFIGIFTKIPSNIFNFFSFSFNFRNPYFPIPSY